MTTDTYTTTTDWTVPAGVTSLDLEAEGNGGGGGSTQSLTRGGGGGGGGERRVLTGQAVVPGDVVHIVVGALGAGAGAGGSQVGTTGGDVTVTINSTSVIVAKGGVGGNATGQGIGGAGGTGGSGGTGTAGTAGGTSVASAGSAGGAGGASGSGAAGGAGGGTGNLDGDPGTAPGGGGGGARGSQATAGGSAGALGRVVVTYTASTSVTGTLASTLDDSTLSASGTETFTGTLASTLTGATLAATGTQTNTGTLASTLAGATLSAAGVSDAVGTMSATLEGASLLADPLVQFSSAVANRETARVNVGLLGCSMFEGYPADTDKWIETALAAKLRAAFPTSDNPGGLGYVGQPSAQVVSGGFPHASATGTYTYSAPGGWGGRHQTLVATQASGVVETFTVGPEGTWSSFDINVGGTPTGSTTGGRYRVDGGSWTAFSIQASPATVKKIHVAAAVTSTVEVGPNNAGSVNIVINGLTAYKGDESKGILVHNFGHYGFTAAAWMQNTFGTPNWLTDITNEDLDLLVLGEFGGNDGDTLVGNIDAATFETNYATLVDYVRTLFAGPIACIGLQDLSASIPFVEPWGRYLEAIQRVAHTKGLKYIPMQANGIPAAPSGTLYYSDGIHGNTDGVLYDMMAQVIFEAIMPPVTGTLTATLDGATGSAAGTETITGALAATTDDAAMSATGEMGMTGTLAATLDDATMSADAVLMITGTITTDLDGATLAATAEQTALGTLGVILEDATLDAIGHASATAARDVTITSVTERARTVTITARPHATAFAERTRAVTFTERE